MAVGDSLTRGMRRLAIGFALMTGCAGSTRQQGTALPSPAVQPTAATTQAARVAPSRMVRLTAAGDVRVTEIAADGAVRIVAGGQRIERRGDSVQVATETFAEPILAALRTDAGWRFVTAHDVFDATDFLGALTHVQTARDGRFGHGSGRPVRITAGRADLATVPGPGFVLDAAFADDQRGVLVLEPGLAYATEDAGRSWRPVALANDPGLAAVANHEARWVVGAETAVEIGRDGAAHEVPLERVPRLRDSDVRADEAARGLALQRDVATWLAHVATRAAFDGAKIIGSRGDRDFEFDLAADSLLESAPHAMPCEPSELFHVDHAYARCSNDTNVRLLERTGAGAWIDRVRAISGADSMGCIVGTDGEHAACRGRCAGESAAGDAASICQHDRDSPPRSIEAPEGQLLGFDGSTPIIVADGNALDTLVVARGTEPARPLAASVESADVRISRATPLRIGPDDRLRAAAQLGATGTFGIVEGRVSGTFVFHPAPAEAGQPHLGPAGNAMAQAPGTWLQTVDDGVHWSALESQAGIPEPAALMLREAARAPGDHELACREAGCTFGSSVARLGWGPPSISRYSARGSAIAAPDVEETAPAWRCESTGATLRVPLLAVEPLAGESVFTEATDAGTLVVRERPAPRAQRGIRVQASWTLHGASPRGAPARASFALERYFATGTAMTRWSIVALRPRSAVLVRCGAGPAGIAPGCDLMTLAPGAPPHVLGTIPAREITAARSADAVVVLTSPDDASVGTSPASFSEPASAERLAVSIRDADARTTTIAVAHDRSGTAGPYVLGSEAGIVRQRSDGTIVLEPVGAPARVLANRPTIEICGADAQGEFVLPVAGALAVRDSGSRDLRVTARYGLAGDVLCLRAIDGSIVQLGRAGWITVTPGIDGIDGTARLREGIAPVRCRFVSPALR